MSEPAKCPASIGGNCLQPSDGLAACREGECDWAVYDRAFPPGVGGAAAPRRSMRKPKRGRLPELQSDS